MANQPLEPPPISSDDDLIDLLSMPGGIPPTPIPPDGPAAEEDGAPRRAAIYARRSITDDEFVTTGGQLARALTYCAKRRFIVDVQKDVFIDRNRSGSTRLGRDGLAALMAAVADGRYDDLVIDRIDRLARNMSDAYAIVEELCAANVVLHTSGSGAVSELEFAFWSLQAQGELTNIRALTRIGQNQAAANGQLIARSGGFGYARIPGTRDLMIDQEQAQVVRRCFEAIRDGTSPVDLARQLNSERVPSPRGGLWTTGSFFLSRRSGLLQRSLFKGRYVWKEGTKDAVVIERPDLAIVSAELFDAVSSRAASSRTCTGRRLVRLLTDVKCSCGAAMRVHGHDPRTGTYRCHSAFMSGGCSNAERLPIGGLEREALLFLKDDLLHPDRLSFWEDVRARDWAMRSDAVGPAWIALTLQMGEIDRRIAELVSGSDGGDKYMAEQIGDLEHQNFVLARSRAKFELPPRPRILDDAEIDELRAGAARLLAGLPAELSAAADIRIAERLREFLPRVVVAPGGSGWSLRFLVGVPGSTDGGRNGWSPIPERWVERRIRDHVAGPLRYPEAILRRHAEAEKGSFAPTRLEWRTIRHLFKPLVARDVDARLLAEALIFLGHTGLPISMMPERYEAAARKWSDGVPACLWREFVFLLGERGRAFELRADGRRFVGRKRRRPTTTR